LTYQISFKSFDKTHFLYSSLQMALQKAVTTKSRFLKEMHTVIIILIVFVIVSYICFLIKNHTYINKRQL